MFSFAWNSSYVGQHALKSLLPGYVCGQVRQFLRSYQRPTILRHFRIKNVLLRIPVWPVEALLPIAMIIKLNHFGLKMIKLVSTELILFLLFIAWYKNYCMMIDRLNLICCLFVLFLISFKYIMFYIKKLCQTIDCIIISTKIIMLL